MKPLRNSLVFDRAHGRTPKQLRVIEERNDLLRAAARKPGPLRRERRQLRRLPARKRRLLNLSEVETKENVMEANATRRIDQIGRVNSSLLPRTGTNYLFVNHLNSVAGTEVVSGLTRRRGA